MSIRKIIAVALLALPMSAHAQLTRVERTGVYQDRSGNYHDKFGDPILFGEVLIPIAGQNGRWLTNPETKEIISSPYCTAFPVTPFTKARTDIAFQINNVNNNNLLKAVNYTVDLRSRRLIMHNAWVLHAIGIPQSPGYQIIRDSRATIEDLDGLDAPLIAGRPPHDLCNGQLWDQIMSTVSVYRFYNTSPGVNGFVASHGSHSTPTPTPHLLPCPSGFGRSVGGYCARYSD